jgi:hypothetical protein
MRKDFVTDPYQVLEARAAGAGGILVIVTMLDDAAVRTLVASARECGLFVLLEAFDARDLERIAAFDDDAKSSRVVVPRTGRSTTLPFSNTIRSCASCSSLSAFRATSSLKSSLIWRVVSTPTITAKPHRITSVSAAEPPARRQRIGRRLSTVPQARST